MKIDYKQAKELCTANEFSLLEQCKPKTLMKFSEEELKMKIRQARKLQDKWRDQGRSQGGASRSGEKEALFAEAVERLERRLALKEKEAVVEIPANAKANGFPDTHESPRSARPLSLKQQAKQNAIVSGQRIDASGLNTRVRGHVAARGRRKEAAREARNG